MNEDTIRHHRLPGEAVELTDVQRWIELAGIDSIIFSTHAWVSARKTDPSPHTPPLSDISPEEQQPGSPSAAPPRPRLPNTIVWSPAAARLQMHSRSLSAPGTRSAMPCPTNFAPALASARSRSRSGPRNLPRSPADSRDTLNPKPFSVRVQ